MLKPVIFSAVLLLPLPAFAGWGEVEWGMRPAEVEATRGAVLQEVEGGLRQYYDHVGGFKVRVVLAFDVGGLGQIEVNPVSDAECFNFMTAVRDTYGAPFRSNIDEYVSAEKWADEANGNLVSLFSMKVDGIPTSCPLLYEPLKKPNSGGF